MLKNRYINILLILLLSSIFSVLKAQNSGTDTTNLHFPFQDDSKVSPINKKKSPLFGKPPSNLEEKVVYDPETNSYKITRKIGNLDYSFPESMSLEEYKKYQFNKDLNNYWAERWKGDSFDKNKGGFKRKFEFASKAFETVFGSSSVEIHPQGSAELIFGLNYSRTDNPALPERLKSTTFFDFQQKIQMNVTGKIGDRMKMGIKYDTEATFEFENEMKLAYEGKEDDIIQKIEAGNVSLPLSGSLISGSQSLWGFKTELRFGKLTVTNVFSQQKGKRSEITVEGGSQVEEFEVYASDYDQNKHFFLAQYFYDNYDQFLEQTNVIQSPIQITKVEAWVTNKTGNFQGVRNVVGFMDLGEGNAKDIYNKNVQSTNMPYPWPSDTSNTLNKMKTELSNWTSVNNTLVGTYAPSVDFERIESARMLKSNEYSINNQLGYISLNTRLNPDEVLAVAFEYTANGKTYRVGEFVNNALPHPSPLVLKLLKGTSISPKLPRWKLMMKNIYALGAYQVDQKDFELHVLYKSDKTGSAMNYLDIGDIKGKILLNVLRLDQLNSQRNPVVGGDGAFDFLDGITINRSKGQIIFPVTEPFGKFFRKIVNNDDLSDKYAYDALYSETQNIAKQEARKNKFVLKGKYQSSSGSEISLNALNVPQGSVTVTAGGQTLTEGTDYTVDYTLGRVKILNQAYLESGTPIRISLESHSLFSMQTKTMLGMHLDYKFNNQFNIGATLLSLTEKPLTTKVNQGEEPISNTVWGLNGSYQTEVPFLTKMVDAIPFIDTKEASSITVSGEFAHLIPGHSSAIGQNGLSYIDDFESSTSKLDQKYVTAWHLASLPRDSVGFPYATATGLESGYNRAKLAWYSIVPEFVREESSTPAHLKGTDAQKEFFVKEVYEQDLWPNKDAQNGFPSTIAVLNLAYYPSERGPYNFTTDVNTDGTLKNPEQRWAGIQRELTTTDFEESNIEYIEFWMMDPYVKSKGSGKKGTLVFNLGDVSEDVLRDSRKSFEQGLPTSDEVKNVDTTIWGRVSSLQSIISGFENKEGARQYQDIGLDGLSDTDERLFYQDYLTQVQAVVNPTTYAKIENDPSTDNFRPFKGKDLDEQEMGIIERYKYFNNPQGNSPVSTGNTYSTSSTNMPDDEDINKDYTLNEAENYYQYEVPIYEGMNIENHEYIVDKTEDNSSPLGSVNWYQFRIPVHEFTSKVGEIYDFKSIRFMRMLLKNFADSTILRFATLDLVRGQWRKFNGGLRQPGAFFPSDASDSKFEITAVNIEENGDKEPVNYVLPPDITRMQDPNNPQIRQLNEQSMVFKVENLQDGDARAAFKNANLDIRQYKKLQMYVHAESIVGKEIQDNDLTAFIRLGSDYTENYYEYEIPLTLTKEGKYVNENQADRRAVWPEANMFSFKFKELTDAKMQRNGDNAPNTQEYVVLSGNNKIVVKGNPTIGDVRTLMIGVRNPESDGNYLNDDGMTKSAEIWFNELRLAEFDEEGGWAANLRMTANLADFANVSLSGSTMKPGYGSIEKKVSERNQDDILQYDVSSNVALGKFFPEKAGVSIPMYVGYSKGIIVPKYNPLQTDLTMKETLNDDRVSQAEKEEIKKIAVDQTTRKSINFTNVKINGSGKKKKKHIYSISNWSVTYAYSSVEKSSVTTERDNEYQHRGVLSYNYSPKPIRIEPFKKSRSKFMRSKSMRLIRDFNFSPIPKQISFMTDMNKRYHEKRARVLSTDDIRVNSTYDKEWTWNRKYDMKWDLTRSLKLSFNALNVARINEPDGLIDKNEADYQEKMNQIRQEIYSLGTTYQYTHRYSLRYNIPINKLPYLNWVTASASWGGNYYWNAGPLNLEKENKMGNTIRNSSNLNINSQANFKSLYRMVPYFAKLDKKYNRPSRSKKKKKEKVYYPEKKESKKKINLKIDEPYTITHKLQTADVQIDITDASGKKVKGKFEVLSKNKVAFTSEKSVKGASFRITGLIKKEDPLIQIIAERTLLAILGIKNISVTYALKKQSLLPGYEPTTHAMGLSNYNSNGLAPGIPFIFGYQDDEFLSTAIRNDWLVKNQYQTNPFTRVRDVNISVRSSIEPIKGFRITLNGNYRKMEDFTNYYQYDSLSSTISTDQSLSSVRGNYSMSINTIATAFEGNNENYSSDAFNNFLAYRSEISQKLGQERQKSDALYNPGGDNQYADGYGPLSQDVLIHSFFTSYTGRKPGSMSVENYFYNIFSMFPGWRVTYNGLSKLSIFKPFFRTITINHAYQSSYNIGSFRTNTIFQESAMGTGEDTFSKMRDINSNFVSEYDVQTVSMNEQFSPLFGVDVSLKNSLSIRLEFKRSRNLTLNLNNAQLSEVKSQEYIVGAGYRFKQVPLRINKKKEIKSDLNMRIDLSVRDNFTIIRQILEDAYQVTSGQNIFTLKYSADYSISQNFNIRFFFDWIMNQPKVSNRFGTTNINTGLSIRFSLS